MKDKILITAPKDTFDRYMSNCRRYLEEEGFEIIQYQGDTLMSADQIRAYGGEISGAIIGCEEWNEDILASCPRLQVLARLGIGVDHIDLEAAKRHGVRVVTARGMNSAAVAEMTVLMAMNVSRNFVPLDRSTRQGRWLHHFGTSLYGKSYGLLGFGAIAQQVAHMLQGFNLGRILAYDMYPNHQAARQLGVEMTDLDTLLRQSDIISIHVPSLPETFHMINAETIACMKPGAILINVARGAIVDESALNDALKSGRIRGAATDVYEQEPPPADHPLFKLDNIIFSPHQAADTLETLDAISMHAAHVVVDTVKYQREPDAANWVNK